MKHDKIQKQAFREIYYYAVEGLNHPNAWVVPDISLQTAELFVAEEDKKWVRDFKMEPVSIEQLKDPQKGFLEICRLSYPDPSQDVDLRKILIELRDVSGRYLTDEDKATPYEPITLEGFIYLLGIKRERLKSYGLNEAAIEKEMAFWEERLGKI